MKKLLKLFSVIALSASLIFATVLPSSASDVSFSNIGNNSIITKAVNVSKVILNKKTIPMFTGSSETLVPTITPTTATNQKVTWKSSNTKIATVDLNGMVTAIKAGRVTITVTTVDGKKTAKCTITIKNPPKVSKIILNKKTISINVGNSETLIPTISPSNAINKNVLWKSSDENLVIVDSNGKITGVKKGVANIVVTTVDGEKTANCIVNVMMSNYPVIFKDINLEKAVRKNINKPTGILYSNDVEPITSLSVTGIEMVEDISGIESLTNLTMLGLGNNKISDISALKGLNKLETLFLTNNKITDINALKELINLQTLHLSQNHIKDISALSCLTNLTFVLLNENQINDISALSDLKKLIRLGASENQIEDTSCLEELTSLNIMDLSNNKIVNVTGLENLFNLGSLKLGNNKIINTNGFENLTALKSLYLNQNSISDVSGLLELENLQSLILSGNQLTSVQKETLENALPNCKISF